VQVIPQSILDRIGEIRQQIIDGTLAITKYQ
jgi:hypothetical protein